MHVNNYSWTRRYKGPVLIVEDNDDDHFALMRALKKGGVTHEVVRSVDAESALEFIVKGMSHFNVPSLIILDLNLPGVDGRDLLKFIKTHDSLRIIPIVVLTTSDWQQDVDRCYENRANSYIVKSNDHNLFAYQLATLIHYWVDVVELPVFRASEEEEATEPSGSRS